MRIKSCAWILFLSFIAYGWGTYPDEQLASKALDLTRSQNLFGACLYKNHDTVVRSAAASDLDWVADQADQPKQEDQDFLSKQREDAAEEAPADRWPTDFYLPNGLFDAQALSALPRDVNFSTAKTILKKLLEGNLSYINAHLDPAQSKLSPPLSDNAIKELGTLPFRTVQLYQLTFHALQEGNLRAAFISYGALAHAIGALTDPLQAVGSPVDKSFRAQWDEKMWADAAAALHVSPTGDSLWSFVATDKDIETAAKPLLGDPQKAVRLDAAAILARDYQELFQSASLFASLFQQYEMSSATGQSPFPLTFVALNNSTGNVASTKVFVLAEQQVGRAAAWLSEITDSIYLEAIDHHPAVDILLNGCESIPFSSRYLVWKYPASALAPEPVTVRKTATHAPPPELLPP